MCLGLALRHGAEAVALAEREAAARRGGGGLATTHHSFLSSFSAVWTATITRNGAFFHIFRDLQDFHAFATFRTHNFKKIHYFCQNLANFPKFGKFLLKFREKVSEI